MHGAIAALTPDQAWALSGSAALERWLAMHGLEWSPAISTELMERAVDVDLRPPRDHPLRPDARALREFATRAASLPRRMREVASLCLDQGLSLRACAERLSISRETVRVHLRRLRALRRLAATRAASAGWCVADDLVQIGAATQEGIEGYAAAEDEDVQVEEAENGQGR